eukprot:9501650-Pyramimonas_sp.AAC.1
MEVGSGASFISVYFEKTCMSDVHSKLGPSVYPREGAAEMHSPTYPPPLPPLPPTPYPGPPSSGPVAAPPAPAMAVELAVAPGPAEN